MSAPKPNRSAQVRVFLVDGYYDLALRIGELIQLEEKLDLGIPVIAKHLLEGQWRVKYLTESVRLGLIGGGMSNRDAFDFVAKHCTSGNLIEFQSAAAQTVLAAVYGAPEDAPEAGEPQAPLETETATPEASPSGAASSSSAEQPATA